MEVIAILFLVLVVVAIIGCIDSSNKAEKRRGSVHTNAVPHDIDRVRKRFLATGDESDE